MKTTGEILKYHILRELVSHFQILKITSLISYKDTEKEN